MATEKRIELLLLCKTSLILRRKRSGVNAQHSSAELIKLLEETSLRVVRCVEAVEVQELAAATVSAVSPFSSAFIC